MLMACNCLPSIARWWKWIAHYLTKIFFHIDNFQLCSLYSVLTGPCPYLTCIMWLGNVLSVILILVHLANSMSLLIFKSEMLSIPIRCLKLLFHFLRLALALYTVDKGIRGIPNTVSLGTWSLVDTCSCLMHIF